MKLTRLFTGGTVALSATALTAMSALPAGAQEVPPTAPIVAHADQCVNSISLGGLCASDLLAFAGHTTSLTHIPPVTGGGNTGNYTFASDACAYYSDPDRAPLTIAEAGTCSFSVSNGTYVNQVCGTGTASGDANVTGSAVVGEAEAPATINFTVYFNAGVGVVEGTETAGDDAGGNVFGVVDITAIPVVDGDCVVTGVNTFRAVGAAGVAEPAGS